MQAEFVSTSGMDFAMKQCIVVDWVRVAVWQVKFFKGLRVMRIAAGRYHTAVCTEMELFTWGRNEGQLGYPKTDVMQSMPKQVGSL